MWLFFWQFSKKFPWACCLEFFFCNSKMANSPPKNHRTRLIIYFYSILWGWWTGNRPQEDLAKFGYRSQRRAEIFGYLTIFLQHATPSSLNLAISQFFPQNMANLERKFQEKTFVWKIFEDRLGMRQGLQESMFPISLTHGYTQIGDKVRSTRVMVPKFSYSWLHLNWGWNRVYKSQDTQFLSVMAILKLGMKQGLQDSRYPISLSHGYSQIGDETGNTRVKVPSFSQSLPRSNWG